LSAGLSPGAATTAIDRLERAGFARRERDPEDRRRVIVEPTDRARELAEEVYGPLRDGAADLMAQFSERQLTAIAKFVDGAADLQLNRANEVRGRLERDGPLSA